MNSILSIDLDIIFSPYVEKYNTAVSRGKTWEDIAQEYDIKTFVPNLEYILIIQKLLKKFAPLVDKIYISDCHHDILKCIQDEINIIYNIDYHHDICYGPDDYMAIQNNISTIGNWVGFLQYYSTIIFYYWYCGHGSVIENNFYQNYPLVIPKQIKKDYLENINFNSILNPDLIFISISSPWIPPNNKNIINDILKLIPEEKKVIFQINI